MSTDADVNLYKGVNLNEYEFDKETLSSYTNYKIPRIKYTGTLLSKLNNIMFKIEYSNIKNGIYHPTYYRHDLSKYDKLPVVLTVYDMIHELFPDQFWNSASVIKSKKASIEHADAIICISENTKKDLMRLYNVPGSKISVIYLSCTLPDTKARYFTDKPYLLYVGDRSASYKNFWGLMGVYQKHFSNDYNLVLFGDGFSKSELKFITENDLKDKVFNVAGNDQILRVVYNGAHCLVYPSLYEGFGIPPLEAMVSGCPVVASNSSSIPEVTGDAAVLFNPSSGESMIKAISSVEDNRDKLISAGYERVKQFSWDKMAKETVDVYKSVFK